MLIDVRKIPAAYPCTILGVGHSDLDDSYLVSNEQFIRKFLTGRDRLELFQKFMPGLTALKSLSADTRRELVERSAKDFEESVGIKSRLIYPGPIRKLAAMAGRAALEHAHLGPTDVDLVLVGTNTPERLYPSTTDEVILELGARQNPFGFNLNEACTTGMAAVFAASAFVRAYGIKVLVIMVDKATLLSRRGYKRKNLFGDRAGAFALGPGQVECYQFFAGEINPFDGNIDTIVQAKDGFEQDGAKVLNYMGKKVPESLRLNLELLGIQASEIDHLFPHTPSVRALDRLLSRLRHLCEGFRGTVHGDVAHIGNTSCATTSSAISQSWRNGQLKSGDLVVVTTFGAGMSIGAYGFKVP